MADTMGKQHKMRQNDTKKSHSWWWDSHISPKNNKWLQENLEEMDQNVNRMLKLIEEDAESFVKKAELYFQKRPELIKLVEEFYRMYRSLADRYDQVTGELRKTIPTDLQSQGSGMSDASSEPLSTLPPLNQRPRRRNSGPRAAGFEFFLGAGGNSTESTKGDESSKSSTLDSDSESDASSVNNYVGVRNSEEDQVLRKRIVELEGELRNVKEKFLTLQEEISEGSYGGSRTGDSEVRLTRITGYEEELKVTREKIKLYEEEVNKLKDELQKYKSMASSDFEEAGLKLQKVKSMEFEEQTDDSEEITDQESKIRALAEELNITKEKLLNSEKEVQRLTLELQGNGSSVHRLQEQLGISQKKLEKEKREVSKLHDRILRYKSNLSERNQEIRGLRETIGNANKSLSEENYQLQAEITRLVKEKTYLEDNIKEMDLRCQSLEENVRRIKAGKTELEAEIETLRSGIEEKNDNIEQLNKCLDDLRLRCDTLVAEKDTLDEYVATYVAEISSKDIQIAEVNKHLQQLHMEHAELLAGAEGERKQVEVLRSRVRDLEQEVEKQAEDILEGAEEKREAIRQLCFSLEHYRDGYHQLRQAFVGHKRLPVMAS